MSTKLTATDYKARLIKLADLLVSINPEKFHMSNWCIPDHTCKTTACVAGWTGILFSEEVKLYLEQIYTKQKLLNKVVAKYKRQGRLKIGSKLYNTVSDEISDLNKEIANLPVNQEPDWPTIARRVLGISKDTASILFYPSNDFWYSVQRPIANSAAALAVRYLAYKPGRRFTNGVYDEDYMRNYIANQQAKEASHVG